jgi:hypothetical protein
MFLLALFVASSSAYAQNPPVNVRMKWQDFISGADGPKRLASLQKAVAKMKSLDNSPPDSVDFRRSWKYWANIHGYLGPNSKFKTVAFQKNRLITARPSLEQFIPFLVGTDTKPGIQDQTPPDAIASAVWATCVHTPPPPNNKQLNFFGWHRIYLYYFERVLRWAANDPSLTLPYWDYTDPAQTGLPDAFQEQDPNLPVSPLYEWRRSISLNEGLSTLDPRLTDIDDPFHNAKNFLDYEGQIETGVHGIVHCTVGQTCPIALMGLVGVAANDPIFYEHHANIDRMWSCWQHAHPNEQPGDWQNEEFSMIDETGALKKRTVKEFLDTRALGYMYDNEDKCTRTPAPTPVAVVVAQGAAAPEPAAKSTATQPIRLNATTTSVDVAVQEPRRQQLQQSVTAGQTTLVLRDVSAQTDPGALLNVYVARKDAPDKREYVGTINWFGVFDHTDGMQHGDRVSRTVRFDVSRALKALGLNDARELTVTFEAASGLVPSAKASAAAAKKGLAPPAAPAFRTGAELSVGAVEIH